MTTFTPNFRLTKPDFNSEGWDTQLNSDLDIIDSVLGQFNTGLAIQGVWLNATLYTIGVTVIDGLTGHIWICIVTHTSALSPVTFLTDRTSNPSYWTDITNPAISAQQSATNSANSATSAAASATASANNAIANVGRNIFINGEFIIQQRGAGPFTTGVYTADRWLQELSTSTISTTVSALVDADRTAIGDEAATSALVSVVGGTAGAGDFALMEQRMEAVLRTGGKNVTVSFWAKANAGTPKVGVGAVQHFGAGGSPTGDVTVIATPVTLSTTWARYTVTLAMPTTIGKTLGTTPGTDFTAIRFWYSSGATLNTAAGGIGVQSATFSLWGVQAELNTIATAFEKKSNGQHLRDCIRFYTVLASASMLSYNNAGVGFGYTVSFSPMRVAPTVTTSAVSFTNASGLGSANITNSGALIFATATGTGPAQWIATLAFSAEL